MGNAKNVRCLNCLSSLSGPYCHQCGQKDQPVAIPIRTLIGDELGELFALDGRLARVAAAVPPARFSHQ
ncbi:MAG: hypothetical protein WEE89_21755 [Gemmatimonadota bacterium]